MRQASCDRCGKAAWVNLVTLGGKRVGEYCADCFELVPHDTPKRSTNRTFGSSGPNHNDPGFDNIVRAIEDAPEERGE